MYIEAWIDAKNMKKGGYMTSKQPEALRLAYVAQRFGLGEDVAVELRRLHEVNDALVQALQIVVRGVPDTWDGVVKAKSALAKAEGK